MRRVTSTACSPNQPGAARAADARNGRCVIIYNPEAGKLRGRRGQEQLERAAGILTAAGRETTLAPSSGPGAAAALARDCVAAGVGLIVAAGGDGTINEVAEGMMHSEVPLGILPAGTANVLAVETGMSRDLETAARELVTYTPERISVGRLHVEDGSPSIRHFLLMAGVGLDARMIYDHLSAPLKSLLGKVAYWIAAVSLMGRRLEEFSVATEHGSYRCSFALVSKVRNYGGDLKIARATSLFDDQFEVVLFQGQSSVSYLRYFVGIALNRLNGMEGVRILRARRLDISPVLDRRVHLQVDGEYVGHLPGSIEIVKDAITLLLPPPYRQSRRDRSGSAV